MASSITTLRPPADQEWVGGIVSMPAFVNDADAPYRPEILLWLNADGLVVGTTLGKPGEVLTRASDHLRATIAKPMLGPPHSPARLRVSSDALASALRAGHPSIEITCARAHAIRPGRAAINAWRRHRSRADGLVFSGRGELFRTKPWKLVPGDAVLSVTVESHGLDQAALSVIGQMGQSLGFLLFSTMDDFDAYLDAAESRGSDKDPTMPEYLVLNFERGADISPGVRKEISAHKWEVAGPRAYPWVAFVDKATVPRPPTAKELALLEGATLALAALAGERKAVKDAFAGGEPFERIYSVPTHAGEIAVTVRSEERR